MSSLADRLEAKFHYVERTEQEMHEYQDLAVKFLLDNRFCALFIDTGLGKTIIVLTFLVLLIMQDRCKKVLIIAPVRVAQNGWPNEIRAWEHTAHLNYTVIRAEDDDPEVISAADAAERQERARLDSLGDGVYQEIGDFDTLGQHVRRRVSAVRSKAATARKEELRLERMRSTDTIHIINREKLTWLIDQYTQWEIVKRRGKKKRVRKIVGWPYDIVVIDESSAFKDHNTARFKAMYALRCQLDEMTGKGWISRLIELTATPAAESYMGLFAQIILLDKGKRLGRFITHYREKNFDYNKYSRVYKLREGAKEEISDKIADLCLVMQSRDYLKEEEPLFLPRTLDLTPAQLSQYKEFARDFILTLDSGEEIEAETAAALSGKLLQLASGAVYVDVEQEKTDYFGEKLLVKKKETRIVHNHKLEDLAELHEELQVAGNNPLLVAYWYKSSLARLKKAFPQGKVIDAAGKIVARHGPWNAGEVPMLFVHPASVGHGLNLQHGPGHDVYMFDMCWSWELFYQLYRRLHRQGQRRQVRIHLPQMRHTLDPLVVERLKMKEDAQEFLFERIRRQRRRMLLEQQQFKMAA